jgi:hypothetical protein
MDADPRPSDGACPRWCNGIHDHPEHESASHRGDPWQVPVIERRAGMGADPFDRIAATDLAVGVEARWGDTWVWITPEDDVRHGLVLSMESAQRLVRTLTRVFGEAAP